MEPWRTLLEPRRAHVSTAFPRLAGFSQTRFFQRPGLEQHAVERPEARWTRQMPPKRAAAAQAAEKMKEPEKTASTPKRARKAKPTPPSPLEIRAIDTVRVLAADMVQNANSGHPGAPMGCAPIAFVLWTKVMNYDPADPKWWGRDRFILSNGHACALLYSMLHLTGYPLSMDDLKAFRQVGSLTPGHPENHLTAGVEVSTGPLGQGISNAVGLAMAEAHLRTEFSREGFPSVIDNFTYVICGDGCLQEGVSGESGSLAGHLGLGRLIVIYDDNKITIDGETDLSFTEDVLKRYDAYGWHTQTVDDVNNLSSLLAAIEAAKAVTDRPSIIKARTVIGFGSLNQGKESTHGAPLGADDLRQVKEKFGFDPDQSFFVPAEVAELYGACKEAGQKKHADFDEMFAAYSEKFPTMAAELARRMNRELPAGWKDKLPKFSPTDPPNGTRKFSGTVLNALAEVLPELMGGSADLTPSNSTALKCTGDFQKGSYGNRYVRFGVREHGMTAIGNGMFAYGGVRPFVATFLNFVGYAMGAVRLSALSKLGLLFITTHDSIGLGEDGPTHQPVEMLEALRATPDLLVFRPADGNETTGAYIVAMENTHRASVMAYSRQNVTHLEGSTAEAVAKGAYTLCDYGDTATLGLVLASTGSEVCICVDVAKKVAATGKKVRVVSMPCWELFDEQPLEYRLNVFPAGVPVMSVEAAGVQGWQKYAHAQFGMKTFGRSGKGEAVLEKFGFTADYLTTQAEKVMKFYEGMPAPSLINTPELDIVLGD